MPNLGSCCTWLLKIDLFVILFVCVPARVFVHMSVLRIKVTGSVSCLDAGNRTQILWKRRKYSNPEPPLQPLHGRAESTLTPNHLSSPSLRGFYSKEFIELMTCSRVLPRHSSAVKSTDCSPRGLWFGSQHSHAGS